jgi:hypothetical protein
MCNAYVFLNTINSHSISMLCMGGGKGGGGGGEMGWSNSVLNLRSVTAWCNTAVKPKRLQVLILHIRFPNMYHNNPHSSKHITYTNSFILCRGFQTRISCPLAIFVNRVSFQNFVKFATFFTLQVEFRLSYNFN